VLRAACDDLGPLAQRANIEPDALAATAFQKITSNSYGIYDGLITSLDAALGQKGRATLRGLLLQRRQEYLTQDKQEDGQGQFFHAFDLDKVVPLDHLVRQIDCLLDLGWVHEELAPYTTSH
jgi:hypothetical protein